MSEPSGRRDAFWAMVSSVIAALAAIVVLIDSWRA